MQERIKEKIIYSITTTLLTTTKHTIKITTTTTTTTTKLIRSAYTRLLINRSDRSSFY